MDITSTTTCSYNNPVYWDGHNLVPLNSKSSNGTDFSFASSTCSIQSTTTGFSYGDITISVLLIIMIILSLTAGVYNFIIGQKRRVPTA